MNNQNSIQFELEGIVIDCLKGSLTEAIKYKLLASATQHEKNPLELFSNANYDKDTSGLARILSILAPNNVDAIIDDYKKYCNNLNISLNLINFLEYLSHQGYHRLHPHIRSIKSLKPIEKPYSIYTLRMIVGGLGIFLLVGLTHPEIWNQIVEYLSRHSQDIFNILLKYIWLAENIAFLTLVYRSFDFLYKSYSVLSNHATTNEHKFKKILKIFLVDSLIILAQTLLYLNKGQMNPFSAYLFIASSFVELLYSAWSLSQLSRPQEPQDIDWENLNAADQANYANYLEATAYYRRELTRSFHELWAFALIAGGTVIAITYSNHLLMIGIIVVIFQLLVSNLKDYIVSKHHLHINTDLQKNIRKLYHKSIFEHAEPSPSVQTVNSEINVDELAEFSL